jgi:hypothetical protein
MTLDRSDAEGISTDTLGSENVIEQWVFDPVMMAGVSSTMFARLNIYFTGAPSGCIYRLRSGGASMAVDGTVIGTFPTITSGGAGLQSVSIAEVERPTEKMLLKLTGQSSGGGTFTNFSLVLK